MWIQRGRCTLLAAADSLPLPENHLHALLHECGADLVLDGRQFTKLTDEQVDLSIGLGELEEIRGHRVALLVSQPGEQVGEVP
jgi:hypothetical protein